ncbi:undecaprenyl-phosphate alpha-N-acetylglucosaminyl 1-phosphatetransferase [Psychromonas ingrahamii 37]|uniref:Undecaprenyl-phosphate alpha-N-acetylglucosaminyl 1-phosphate transferase n=1 Tax=Psychromonas ingrahamii (strain DSM 17664 / CCUG 51855 / 37) TaxID=357804 RepID=A1ST24_PSYIN|nr:UDP-N-acetylglucosamine--undecaprenyl-phosphate N-acetylglucosaminephosphotransferase [Psychromonas ingrahamii]ABM02639.1 undecaprenyl-phosphate alpha-N-acetylglucosaminyl 1-phosphatetransferase [Psychromonas ingrahamii 37]
MLFYFSVLIFAFVASFSAIKVLKPLAVKLGLTDKPNARKNHRGEIPLVGGISVYIGLFCSGFLLLIVEPVNIDLLTYLFASLLMVVTGALDDRFDLSVRIRILAQVLIASIMMFVADRVLFNLGDLLSIGEISLGYFAYPFTVLAVLGAINAYNMIDGIDGLIGGVSFATFVPLTIIFYMAGDIEVAFFCLLCVVVLAPYLLHNLQLTRFSSKKIFMGDAGSMFIGFTVIWLLAIGSQGDSSGSEPYFSPVVAVWFIALPLMDMTAIIIRRIKKGNSPFAADRDHLHHLFMRAGFTPRQTLIFITCLALMLSMIGVFTTLYSIPDWIQLVAFITLFGIFQTSLAYIWVLLKTFRKIMALKRLAKFKKIRKKLKADRY